MAKGKNNRSCAKNGNMMSCNGPSKSRSTGGANNIELTQEAIDRHWDALPPTAKSFILDTPDGMFPLNKLIKYWSQPQNNQCCQGGIAGSICGATWYLALVYLKMRMWKEARALTINGAFIHQCYNSSIELIKEVCESGNVTNAVLERKLPYFVRGFNSIRSPETMEKFIRSYLPKEYTQMMTSFANLSSSKSMRGYVDQISNDWKGDSSPSRNNSRSKKGIHDDGTKIQLDLVDDADENERHSFDICSSTTLKSLFNDYADKRGISLRLLRFSYRGNMLFLSSAGHKTPEELNMKDQDIIEVHDTSKSQQESDGDSSDSQPQRTASRNKKSKKGSKNKKSKKKSNKKSQPHVIELSMSMEEYKVEHSKKLTKIHDEAATQFKQIRQRLNNLVIERSQPKNKSKRPRSPKSQPTLPVVVNNPAKVGLGGKAGKSHFVVQVGEVQNLYKSTKRGVQHNVFSIPLDTLDLHGCTQDEALMKLDDTLKTWVDAAMQGSYPFVQQAVIVCGCGNQVLSETVQDWIKATDKVSNAPKQVRSCTRRRGFGAIAA